MLGFYGILLRGKQPTCLGVRIFKLGKVQRDYARYRGSGGQQCGYYLTPLVPAQKAEPRRGRGRDADTAAHFAFYPAALGAAVEMLLHEPRRFVLRQLLNIGRQKIAHDAA